MLIAYFRMVCTVIFDNITPFATTHKDLKASQITEVPLCSSTGK